MSTNQEVYAQTGIQVSDIQAIAAKFGYSVPYSQEQVELMSQIRAEAGKAGLTIKKFLATIEVGQPASSAPDRESSAIDTNLATEQFQSSIASVTQGLTTTAVELYQTLDDHLTIQEEAFSDAVFQRVMSSPVKCMTLVAEKLGVQAPGFFRLAPEGAQLSSFVIPGAGDSASTQAVLKSAVPTDAQIVQ